MSSKRRSLAAAAAVLALVATASACKSSDAEGDSKPTPSQTATTKPKLDLSLPTSLPTSVTDLKKWEEAYKRGAWKNWDKSQWLRKAADFVNPVIDGLWNDDRMKAADPQDKNVPVDVPSDQGQTDRAPAPVTARAAATPYHQSAPDIGKLFFDSPKGSMVCSATVIEDPAHPGKSNLVWTAGHCVHAGAEGGWYRNIAFVPAYNDSGKSAAALKGAKRDVLAPYGVFWADGASTSQQWIDTGAESGGSGSPYDFAVLHVEPEKGGKSLEETVGSAMPVWFDAPATAQVGTLDAYGYPAAPPYDGQRIFDCAGKPGRLSLDAQQPTEYRIGCTMTGGSSGGGWFAERPDGKTALVSNTSIGPVTATWLAGPRLGADAKKVYDAVSKKFS
jgi:V8-like Glu-specific endopeptidase